MKRKIKSNQTLKKIFKRNYDSIYVFIISVRWYSLLKDRKPNPALYLMPPNSALSKHLKPIYSYKCADLVFKSHKYRKKYFFFYFIFTYTIVYCSKGWNFNPPLQKINKEYNLTEIVSSIKIIIVVKSNFDNSIQFSSKMKTCDHPSNLRSFSPLNFILIQISCARMKINPEKNYKRNYWNI